MRRGRACFSRTINPRPRFHRQRRSSQCRRRNARADMRWQIEDAVEDTVAQSEWSAWMDLGWHFDLEEAEMPLPGVLWSHNEPTSTSNPRVPRHQLGELPV